MSIDDHGLTSGFLARQLLELHPGDQWATYLELPNGTGGTKARTIDLYALHLWPSERFRSIAYELKISRADFRRELDDPTKRAPWEKLASEGWYVAPAGVIPMAEVPERWGLMEWTGRAWRRPKRAQQRVIEAWPPSFVASLARRSCDPKPPEPLAAWDFLGRRITAEDLVRLADKLEAHRRRQGIELPARPREPRPTLEPWEFDQAKARREQVATLGELARAVNHAMGRRWGTPTAAEFTTWWETARTAGSSPETNDQLREARRLVTLALEALDPGEAAEARAERENSLIPNRYARSPNHR